MARLQSSAVKPPPGNEGYATVPGMDPYSSAMAGKAGVALISAVTNIGTQKLWGKLASARGVAIPSFEDAKPVAEWFSTKLTSYFQDNEVSEIEHVAKYLQSMDFVTLTQNLAIFQIAGHNTAHSSALLSAFANGLRNYGFSQKNDIEALFRIVSSACDQIVGNTILAGKTVSPEVQLQASQLACAQYLESIENHLGRLANYSNPVEPSLDTRLSDYAKIISRQYGTITPPAIDGGDPVSTESLFIEPKIFPTSKEESDVVEWNTATLLGQNRVVILGDPGGGKTTVSRRMAKQLADKTSGLSSVEGVVPILIVLRDFGTYFTNGIGSIADYISTLMRKNFQINVDPSSVEYLLDSGRLATIFDGLDELLQSHFRKDVAAAIDAFALRYPLVKVIVTSRRVGYQHSRLDSSVFVELSIGEFDYEKTHAYVVKWFAMTVGGNAPVRPEILAKRFMSESDHAKDIRANPLMLGLMCTLYRREAYIPRNRPELYEKCSKLLFETWDRSRGLFRPVRFEAHVKPALSSLAYSIYLSQTLQGGVAESKLISMASDYLLGRAYTHEDEARHAAIELVDYCKGRTWILTEVGLSERDEPLFQFSHRTFLEYYTAVQYSRTSKDIEELYSKIVPGIKAGQLDVVAELAFQIKARDTEDASDWFVKQLLSETAATPDAGARDALSQFITRSLSYSVLSPGTVDDVARMTLSYLICGYEKYKSLDYVKVADIGDDGPESDIEQRLELLHNICFRSATEIRGLVATSLCTLLSNCLETYAHDELVEVVAAIAWKLPESFSGRSLGYSPDPAADDWSDFDINSEKFVQLRTLTTTVLRRNKAKWAWAAVGLFYEYLIEAEDLFAEHPESSVVRAEAVPHSRVRYFPPMIYIIRKLFSDLQGRDPEPEFLDYASILEMSAAYLRENRPLQIELSHHVVRMLGVRQLFEQREGFSILPLKKLDDACRLDFFTVVCAASEVAERTATEWSRALEKLGAITPSEDIATMCEILLLRDKPEIDVAIVGGVDEVLERWMKREVDFFEVIHKV